MTDKEMDDMYDEVAAKVGPLPKPPPQTNEEMKAQAHAIIDASDCFIISGIKENDNQCNGMFFMEEEYQHLEEDNRAGQMASIVVLTMVKHRPQMFADALEYLAKTNAKKMIVALEDPELRKMISRVMEKLDADLEKASSDDINDERNIP